MNDGQVKVLLTHLMTGTKIDRVEAYQWYGIGDLRSRICDVEKQYGVKVDRNVKPGKRYKEYFIKRNSL